MDFSAVESRVNASVFGRLANARAIFGAGPDSFPITFDKAGGLVDANGVVTQAPSFTMQPALHAVSQGDSITINAVAYRVRSVTLMDEGGWQRVELARA